MMDSYSDLRYKTYERFRIELAAAIAADETGERFVFSMFLNALQNHEYGCTGKTEDALDALGYSVDDVMADSKLKRGFEKALKVLHDWEHNERTMIFVGSKEESAEDLYRCIETGKVHIRRQCDEGHVRWLTTANGKSHKPDRPMRSGLAISVVDKTYSLLFVEEIVEEDGADDTWAAKGGPFSWEAIKV